MLYLDLDDDVLQARRESLMELAAAAETLRKFHGPLIAIEYLFHGLGGVQVSPVYGENYLTGALDFQLGLLHAHLGDPERASAYIERCGVLPNAGGDQLYSDHVASSLALHRQMMEARERGMPSILMSSMPRSASASLTQSLSATMTAPVLRMSAGHFPGYYVIPRWLNSLSPGGAVTHDHLSASPFNLKVLKDGGCRDIFVLIRDPRAGAASYTQFKLAFSHEQPPRDHVERRIVQTALELYYPWLEEWIAAERTSGLRLHWLKSSDVGKDMAAVIASILQRFRSDYPAVERVLDGSKEVKVNFVGGDDDAWRAAVSSASQERLWKELPPGAIELLELRP
jgi:hypothetical protein